MVYALITMGGLGLLFAAFLALADKFLRVEENPLIAEINEQLPNANCGACGYAGCYAFAEAVVEGKAPVNGCPVGGADTATEVAKLMGVDADTNERLFPVLMCQGSNLHAHFKPADYKGPRTCEAMDLVSGGDKLCVYGCLGGGDCVVACPFDAMIMNKDGLPEVVKDLCTGCGVCVQACPRDVLEMHPESRKVFVFCKNEEDPKRSRTQCDIVCLGCSSCGRNAEGAITMCHGHGNIDYDKLDINTVGFDRCPTGAIVNLADFDDVK